MTLKCSQTTHGSLLRDRHRCDIMVTPVPALLLATSQTHATPIWDRHMGTGMPALVFAGPYADVGTVANGVPALLIATPKSEVGTT